MEDSEGTVRQIGAFSEGIQNLTVRISSWPRTNGTLYSLIPLFHKLNIVFSVMSPYPEHAKRRWILQRGFQFTEPQRNRRGLHGVRQSASRALVLLRMKLWANPSPLLTDLAQQTPRLLQHFILGLHSKMSQKYYRVSSFSVSNDGFVAAYSPFTPELCLRQREHLGHHRCLPAGFWRYFLLSCVLAPFIFMMEVSTSRIKDILNMPI